MWLLFEFYLSTDIDNIIFASGRSESAELVLNADNRVLHFVDLTFLL